MAAPRSLRQLCPACHREVGAPCPEPEGDQFTTVELMRANRTPCLNTSCAVYIEWEDDNPLADDETWQHDVLEEDPQIHQEQCDDKDRAPDQTLDADCAQASSTASSTSQSNAVPSAVGHSNMASSQGSLPRIATRNSFTDAEVRQIFAWRAQGYTWAAMEQLFQGRHTRRSIESKWRDVGGRRNR